MANVQYVNGNKKTLIILIFYLACWMLYGFIANQYINLRLAEIKQIKNAALAIREMKSLTLWTIIIPSSLFFIISAAQNFHIGFVTLKQKQYPPIGISMPFRTKLLKEEKAKQYGYGYVFGACISLITVLLFFIFWDLVFSI